MKQARRAGHVTPFASTLARAMESPAAGLCQTCRHGKQVVSGRGSVFLLCLLHESDPRFAKYPRLPVVRCSGFVAKGSAPG